MKASTAKIDLQNGWALGGTVGDVTYTALYYPLRQTRKSPFRACLVVNQARASISFTLLGAVRPLIDLVHSRVQRPAEIRECSSHGFALVIVAAHHSVLLHP
jgi:hypothetical protein